MSTEDDEALSWVGDNDERLTAGATSTSPIRKRRESPSSSSQDKTEPSTALGGESGGKPGAKTDVKPDTAAEADADLPRGISSGEGIALGVLGGIYLLFTAAWIVTALGNPVQIEDPVGSFMFVFGLWLAAAAPALWFAAMLVMGRRRSFLWRFAMLALGAALVIPWPYLIRGVS
jgi:hypothetical protein